MATNADMKLLYRAMHNADTLVAELDYTDAAGERSRRNVSPIRTVRGGGMLVWCLASGEPRQLKLERIGNVRLVDASSVLVPEPKVVQS